MPYFSHDIARAIPIIPLRVADFDAWIDRDPPARAWAEAQRFTAKPDTALLLPGPDGKLAAVLAGIEQPNVWCLAHLPGLLPAGTYAVEVDAFEPALLAETALGFALAQYQFTRYKKGEPKNLTLALPDAIDIAALERRVAAQFLVRDLINTPANDMGPSELAEAARNVAAKGGAEFDEVVGDDLLTENYPAIHAVGRANPNAPRLIELNWGNPKDPLLVLVGKGVTFDTGGLDIKPYASMKLMKKDMGGAALMLGLAQLIMGEQLPVRLRVLIPAVENSIAGNAFRPQDILQSRKGLTIEIGSTDAEGRVILADALAEGDSAEPALMIDAATLTGAARTALGTDLPALFSNRDDLVRELFDTSHRINDPLWPLPLWKGYGKYVNGTIADVTNSPNYGFAGSITAALFLERFVSADTPWIHLDTYAWNAEAQPGRPAGGEALALRALFTFIRQRFA